MDLTPEQINAAYQIVVGLIAIVSPIVAVCFKKQHIDTSATLDKVVAEKTELETVFNQVVAWIKDGTISEDKFNVLISALEAIGKLPSSTQIRAA